MDEGCAVARDYSTNRVPLSLSIVTVCYDDTEGVQLTLQSILRQRVSNLSIEVIVIDGSQCAATKNEFNEFRTHFTGTAFLVSEPDAGVYDAMNKGIDRATGNYIQFLNSGDSFFNERSFVILESHLMLSPTWVVSGAYHGMGTGLPQVKIENTPFHPLRHRYGMQSHCHQACWFMTSAVRDIGGYRLDIGFVADYDLIAQFGKKSAPDNIEDELILYQGGGISSQGGSEIPSLIGHARRDRFYGKNTLLNRMDRVFVRLQIIKRLGILRLKKLVRETNYRLTKE